MSHPLLTPFIDLFLELVAQRHNFCIESVLIHQIQLEHIVLELHIEKLPYSLCDYVLHLLFGIFRLILQALL